MRIGFDEEHEDGQVLSVTPAGQTSEAAKQIYELKEGDRVTPLYLVEHMEDVEEEPVDEAKDEAKDETIDGAKDETKDEAGDETKDEIRDETGNNCRERLTARRVIIQTKSRRTGTTRTATIWELNFI